MELFCRIYLGVLGVCGVELFFEFVTSEIFFILFFQAIERRCGGVYCCIVLKILFIGL